MTSRCGRASRGTSVALVALLTFIGVGCQREVPVKSNTDVPLSLEVNFPSSSQASSHRGDERVPTIDAIRATAWQVTDQNRRLVDDAEATIKSGQSHFSLELTVRTGFAYEIEVEASGFYVTGAARSEDGVLYFGDVAIPEIHGVGPVEATVALRNIVPLLREAEGDQRGYRARWTSIRDVTRYHVRVRQPDGSVIERTPAASETSVVIEVPALQFDEGSSSHPLGIERSGADALIRVRAEFADSLVSAYSEAIVVTATENTVPGAPVLTLNLTAPDSIEISWTAPGDDGFELDGGVEEYELRFAFSPMPDLSTFTNGTRISLPEPPAPAGQPERYLFGGALPDTAYYFRLRARDEVPTNWSELSGETFVRTPDTTPPDSVTGLALTGNGDAGLHLEWLSSGDDGLVGAASRYEIKWSEAFLEDATWDKATAVRSPPIPARQSGILEELDLPDLPRDEQVWVSIRVYDNRGNPSPLPNARSAVVPDERAPARIEDLSADAEADGRAVLLSWHASGDDDAIGTAASYDLRRAFVAIDASNWDDPTRVTRVTSVPTPGTAGDPESTLVEGLEPDRTYHFAIRSIDNRGNQSEISVGASVLTPALPEAPSALAVARISDTSLGLSWTDNADNESGFAISRRRGTSGPFALLITIGPSTASEIEYTDTNLTERTRYDYQVRATNAVGLSAATPIAGATTQITAPTSLQVTRRTASLVDLAWGFVNNPPGTFLVERQDVSGEPWALIGSTPDPFTRSYIDQSVSPNTTYSYRVRAYANGDTSEPSNVVQASTDDLNPLCAFSVSNVDYSDVPVDAEVRVTLELRNNGGGSLEGQLTQPNCADFILVGAPIEYHVTSEEPQALTIAFAPQTQGEHTCRLAASPTCFVDLAGYGTLPPTCSLSTTLLEFGDVQLGNTSIRTVNVSNVGDGQLSGSVALPENPGPFSFLPDAGFDFELEHEDPALSIAVTFAPTTAEEWTREITIPPCGTVSLHGRGVAHECSVVPATVDFGDTQVGLGYTRTVRITNTESLGWTVDPELSASCASSFSIVSGGEPRLLAAGQSVDVGITFRPEAVGTFTCALETGCDEAASLTGTGVDNNAYWQTDGPGPINGPVNGLAVLFDRHLAAVGEFTSLGTQQIIARNVGLWTDGTWTGLASPASGPTQSVAIHAISVDGPSYYIEMYTGSTDRVWAWNNLSTQWSTWITNGIVNTLAIKPDVYYDHAIAGGVFTSIDYESAPHLAISYYDGKIGTYWQSLYNGRSGTVYCMRVDESGFYAGGAFAGNEVLSFWDGKDWQDRTHGLDGAVYALADWNGSLVAGGAFRDAGSESVNYVAVWNGAGWSPIGTGFDGPVRALAIYRGDIVAGGDFAHAGSREVGYVARWNGASWEPLGSGVTGSAPRVVRALEVLSDGDYEGLYVGGNFQSAGGGSSTNIARWNEP